ncbi:WXG100 family type VII secretion target [Phycicoccus sp. 3266]|jgi:WXG100 family type VII secretion target|uniref:WXG100 family type VII secretion target n=1 Tax=Phycicoccus sp. 3266 TaxID=2817751 RepID=UPI0028565BF3|nr:WXG100 family type VII secretion target [Phycicoccus sp. 3266]MDR6861846.1 WXG100 family type VII secretion target [Phycicoccus sp. 3266]
MLAAGDGVLQKGAAVVADYKGQLDGELAALEGRLAGLKSMWQGQGAAGFDRTFNLWKDDSKKIIAALDTFEANLRETDRTFRERDENAAQAISNKYGGM